MSYEFKNLNEVERQDKPTENTTVMAFESGNPRQIPASEFGGKGLVVDLRGYTASEGTITVEDMSYDPIYEAITAGQNVVLQMYDEMFTTPILVGIIPREGFIMLIFSDALNPVGIKFTNGSYHTTA